MTPREAFKILKSEAAEMRVLAHGRPRAWSLSWTRYCALVIALYDMMDLSGSRELEDQIKDEDVRRWYLEIHSKSL